MVMTVVMVAIVMMLGAVNAAVDDLVSVMMSVLGSEPMQTMAQDCDAAVGGNQQNRHELSGSASHGRSQMLSEAAQGTCILGLRSFTLQVSFSAKVGRMQTFCDHPAVCYS
jgi:hypothetical protein